MIFQKLHALLQLQSSLEHARTFLHHESVKHALMMLTEGTSMRLSFTAGPRAKWFDAWGPELDEALAELPELEMCPHDVFREMARTPSRAMKRLALIHREGEPIAVACVRRRLTFWEPLLEEAVPFDVIPAKSGELGNALRALGLEVSVSGYPEEPSALAPTAVTPYAFYRANLRENFEEHWRKEDRLYTIRKARKRTAGLKVRWDHPADVDWIVKTWTEMWSDDPAQQTLAAADRLVASRMLLQRGQLHSVALLDGDEPVAGATHVVRGKALLFHCNARDRSRGPQAVGTRVLDETFQWAAANGFESFDLGGGMDYKRWWAPTAGERYHLRFCPPLVTAARRLAARFGPADVPALPAPARAAE